MTFKMLYYIDLASVWLDWPYVCGIYFHMLLAYYCTEPLLLRLWAASEAATKSMPEETLAELSPDFPL